MARTLTLVATSLVSASSSRRRRMRQTPFQSSQRTCIPHQKNTKSKSFIDLASPHKTLVSPRCATAGGKTAKRLNRSDDLPLLKDHFKGTLYFENHEPSSEQNYNRFNRKFYLELCSLQGRRSLEHIHVGLTLCHLTIIIQNALICVFLCSLMQIKGIKTSSARNARRAPHTANSRVVTPPDGAVA